MTRILLEQHLKHKAPLHAFVVMSHHIHTLSTAPRDRTVSWLYQRIKTASSKIISSRLTEREIEQLKMQSGLNERRIWQRSFRGVPIKDETMFWNVAG